MAGDFCQYASTTFWNDLERTLLLDNHIPKIEKLRNPKKIGRKW